MAADPEIATLRLLEAIKDAPLVPEGYIDRVANGGEGFNPAFKAIRWDVDAEYERRRIEARGRLTPRQLDVLQSLAQGEPAPKGRRYTGVLHSAGVRLGARHGWQAMAIATNLGLVEVSQLYVLGPAFRVNSSVRNDDPIFHEMTDHQRTIVALIANGYEDKEIGEKLGISLETVKSITALLRRRYGARNRAHLATLALRFGHIR